MIPRAEIEFTKAMAEKGLRSETPPEVMVELCRVYLAYRDAPEAYNLRRVIDEVGGKQMKMLFATPAVRVIDWPAGKRVKLVEVPDE